MRIVILIIAASLVLTRAYSQHAEMTVIDAEIHRLEVQNHRIATEKPGAELSLADTGWK